MHHNILIVPFEPWHIEAMNIREEQKPLIDWYKEVYGDIEIYGNQLVEAATIDNDGNKIAWTGLKDGFPIAAGGIYQLTPYMGQAWVLATEDFKNGSMRDKMGVIKGIKEALDNHNLQRVQADTEVWFKDARKFLEALGFHAEGVMEAYTPTGDSSVLYSKIKET